MPMTNQVKSAITRMLAAGFIRKEFHAKAERKIRTYQGVREREFGDAVISTFCPADVVYARKDAILGQNFGLQVWFQDGKPWMCLIDNTWAMRGKLVTHSMEALVKWEAENLNK